jgi:hypothetical protein
MTITDRRPREASPAAASPPAAPRVNLLPPEVREARQLSGTKRRLALVLVAVLVLCAAGYVLSVLRENAADEALLDEQNVTVQLQSDAAQFSEVPRVQAQLDRNRSAREYGMSPDVAWSPYVVAIATVLPAEAKIEQITANVGSPLASATAQVDPLQPLSAGRLELVARMPVLPNTADWMDSLDSLTGLDDVRVSSTEVAQGEDGPPFYRVTVSAQLSAQALTGQYSAQTEES